MQFFSIYDLILYKAREKNMALDDVMSFFRSKKIKKTQIEELKQTSFIPGDKVFEDSIEEFLGMNKLEIALLMGRIPTEYRKSFFENVQEIAKLLKESIESESSTEIVDPFFENEYGTLYKGDCIKIMKQLPDESVDLVFADPPFNIGKTYDEGIRDDLTMSEYLNWTYSWLDECIRILKPGGRIFVYNLPKWSVYIAEYLGRRLSYWDWIAVEMKLNLPIQNRLYPAHYALVAYTKGVKASTYVNQRIPLQTCRHCGGEIKDYGGYKSKMNRLGVNVSDVWTDIYPVRHKSKKNRQYNELPVKLLDRIISLATNEGDIVFDPFGGSGTTYATAQLLNRKWIGCELGDCEIIKNRLLDLEKDKEQLKKINEEKNQLFPSKVLQLREKNNFWL